MSRDLRSGSYYESASRGAVNRKERLLIRGKEVLTKYPHHHIIPNRDDRYVLGTSNAKWKEIWTKKLFVDSGQIYFNSKSLDSRGANSRIAKKSEPYNILDGASIRYSGSNLTLNVPTTTATPATASVSVYQPFISDNSWAGSEKVKIGNFMFRAGTSNDFPNKVFAKGAASGAAAENLRDVINYWGNVSGSNPTGGFYFTSSVSHSYWNHTSSLGDFTGSIVYINTKDSSSKSNNNKFAFYTSGSSYMTSTGSTVFWSKFGGGLTGRNSDAQVIVSNRLDVKDEIHFNTKTADKGVKLAYNDSSNVVEFRDINSNKSLLTLDVGDVSSKNQIATQQFSGSLMAQYNIHNASSSFIRLQTKTTNQLNLFYANQIGTHITSPGDSRYGWYNAHFSNFYFVSESTEFTGSGHSFWHDRKFVSTAATSVQAPRMHEIQYVQSGSGDTCFFPYLPGGRGTQKILIGHSSSINALDAGIILSGSISASGDLYLGGSEKNSGTPTIYDESADKRIELGQDKLGLYNDIQFYQSATTVDTKIKVANRDNGNSDGASLTLEAGTGNRESAGNQDGGDIIFIPTGKHGSGQDGRVRVSGSYSDLYVDGEISASGNIYLENQQKLYLQSPSTVDSYIKAGGTGNLSGLGIHSRQDPITLYQGLAAKSQLFITSSGGIGLVGIGTLNPKKQLEVVGDVSASGDLSITNITASGGISASGTLFGGQTLYLNNNQIAVSTPSSTVFGNAGQSMVLYGTNHIFQGSITASADISSSANLSLTGHITSSGNISSSGTLIANAITLPNDSISGDLIEGGTIGSTTITDLTATKLNVTHFTSSFITSSTIVTEGSNTFGDTIADTHTFNGHITASGNISASGDILTSGDIYLDTNSGGTLYGRQDSGNVSYMTFGSNITIASDGVINFKETDADPDNTAVTINVNTGQISSSGAIQTDSHITASGNISSSGVISAGGGFDLSTTMTNGSNNRVVTATGAGAQNAEANLLFDGSKLEIGGKLKVSSHITASGNISGSSTSTINVGGAINTLSHITASGNISSSLTGSFSKILIGNPSDTDHHLNVDGHVGLDEDLHMKSNKKITWSHGDASIQEGAGTAYSLGFNTYDGSSTSQVMLLEGNNSASFTGNVTVDGDISASGDLIGIGKLYLSGQDDDPSSSIDVDGAKFFSAAAGAPFFNLENAHALIGLPGFNFGDANADMGNAPIGIRAVVTNGLGATYPNAPGLMITSGTVDASNPGIFFDFSSGNGVHMGIRESFPTKELQVRGDISSSGAIYGGGQGVILSSSVSDTTLFSVNHPISGTVFQVSAEQDSGSMVLSGSLELKSNAQKPDDSGSRLYNYNGELEFNGVPIGHTQYETKNCNMVDDLGTTKHYIPLSEGTFEQSSLSAGGDECGMLAPCSGSLVSLTMKLGNLTAGQSGQVSFTLEKETAGASHSSPAVFDTQVVDFDGDTDDYNVVNVLFDSDATIAPGDLIYVGVQASADMSATTYWFTSTIWKWDYSTILGHQVNKG